MDDREGWYPEPQDPVVFNCPKGYMRLSEFSKKLTDSFEKYWDIASDSEKESVTAMDKNDRLIFAVKLMQLMNAEQ